MNEQNFAEHVYTPNIVEEANPNTSLVANSDLYGNTIPTAENLPVEHSAGLFNGDEIEQFRTRWNQIQGNFVDEPRTAVEQADALISEIVEKITRMFAEQKDGLENQWKQGNEVSTEEMRKTLQNYRSFFNSLVDKV